MAERRRRRIGATVAGIAVIGICGAMFMACTPMTREYWSARSALQEMLGDRGEVSGSITERNINVQPRCGIRIAMREGVSPEDYADVLADIGETLGGSECEVYAVGLQTRAEVSAQDWNQVAPEVWPVVAERAHRVPGSRFHFDAEGRWRVHLTSFDGSMPDGVAGMTALIEGAPLESALGTTEWDLGWHGEGSPFQDIDVSSDATPPMELMAALEQIAQVGPDAMRWSEGDGVAEADDEVIGMNVKARVDDGVTNLRVDLSVTDWNGEEMAAHESEFLSESKAARLAASILDAVESSGLRLDTVRVVANQSLVWGDAL